MDIETELATLCRSCGLCCDGSLFGRVMFEPGDAAPTRRLRVIESGRGFEQPCSALTHARTCSIYAERPVACRRFVCRLHDRHRRERGPLEARITAVRRTRELVAQARDLAPDDAAELTHRLEEDFARVPGPKV